MAVKDIRFDPFTRKNAQQVRPAGAFSATDTVLIHFTVPDNASRVLVLVAQIQSDADLALRYNGKARGGLLSASIELKNPAPGEHTAVLTSDGPVHDVNVHVTVQTRKD